MFLYNITIKIDWLIQNEWLQWLYDAYLPYIMETNCFEKYQVVKLLEVEDAEGPTYAVQVYAENKANYDRYLVLYLPQLEAQIRKKWNGQMLTFATLMEVIER